MGAALLQTLESRNHMTLAKKFVYHNNLEGFESLAVANSEAAVRCSGRSEFILRYEGWKMICVIWGQLSLSPPHFAMSNLQQTETIKPVSLTTKL